MNLARWSLRYPITSSVVILSIVVLGALTAPRLPLAFLPEVDFPGLEINIPYPNALPAQVEEEIVRPAEEALATMSRIRRINSWSNSSSGNIYVQFDWGEDIGPLRVEAREKLDRIRDLLPRDVDLINVNGFRSTDIPVLECRISADRDLSRSYELLNRHVADPLRRVPGVAKVELYGVERPQVLIEFSLDALERHSLSATEVLARVEASNRSISAGQLRRGDEVWPLRVVNQFATLEEIGNLSVSPQGLRLHDLAAISYREPDLDYGRHLNDTRAIGLNVIKESGSNTVEVARRARKALDEIGNDPEIRGIQVLTFTDQAEQITNSLEGLLEAGLIGAALAVAVLFFFLRNWVTTLIVATAIPFSLLAASALMYFTGRTLNILSMMGLMLAVGMLVDNAVVVLESIYRHRQLGQGPLRSALVGAKEVQPAVVCSTLATVIVFLPLVLGGRTEITTWLGEVGRTIIFAVGCSLYLSLTAIPLTMGRIIPKSSAAPRPGGIERLSDWYQHALAWTMKHRLIASSAALVFFLGSVGAFIPVNKSAFTATRVEAVRIEYEFADNLNYREVEKYVTKIENWILARKDSLHVKSTYSYFTHNFAFTRAYLADGYADDEGSEGTRKLLRRGIPELPGTKLKIRGNDDDEGGASRLAVNVFGDPGPRLDALAEEVRRRIALVPGTEGMELGGEKGSKEIEVFVQRDRAARYGLSATEVASSVALFFRGQPLSRFRGPEGEVQLQARLAEADRKSLDRLKNMPIVAPAATGSTVPLGAVADFRLVETPSSIERQQRRSVVTVAGDIDSKKNRDVRKQVTRELNAMAFPPGYIWSYGNAFEEENATQMEMLLNLVLALALVYVVMAALFESFLHPFAIMFALPFAFCGIAWMCFLTGTPFNLMSQIGLLILVGIVVNNGIVLLYYVHQLRQGGMDRSAALMRAGRDRLRPILMTTATTTLGLLPLALGSTHVGDVMYYPLARTVIGGLLVSTALTLVLVPCLYTLLEDGANLVKRLWRQGPRVKPSIGAAVSALAIATMALASQPGNARAGETPVPVVTGSWPATGLRSLHFVLPAGEVRVVGTDGSEIRGKVELDCWLDDEDCLDRARNWRFTTRRAGSLLVVRLRGGPSFNFLGRHAMPNVLLEVPRSLLVELDMPAGEVVLSDLGSDVDVALGAGEVDIRVPRKNVGAVRMRVGVGEMNLDHGEHRIERVSVFGNGIHWKHGPGRSTVAIRLGAGEANVVLN